MSHRIFKAKLLDSNEWVEGSYINMDYHNSLDYEERHQIMMLNGHWFNVDPETVSQSTGIYDRNQDLVFEGDWVKTYSSYTASAASESIETLSNEIYEVFFGPYEWSDDGVRYEDHYGFYIQEIGSDLKMPLGISRFIVIVGDRFNNPELLNQ
jgi:hypothetical protein